MTAGCLLDTNILLCLANSHAPGHAAAISAVARLLADGERLAVAPQVLFEFWSVATRPVQVNGLGMPTAQALAEVEAIRARFLLLAEPPTVIDFWLEIVGSNDLKGKRIHDAHLMATMKANGVTRLLTFNAADFPADQGVTIRGWMDRVRMGLIDHDRQIYFGSLQLRLTVSGHDFGNS